RPSAGRSSPGFPWPWRKPTSVRLVGEHRVDRSAPRAVELLDQVLGRGDAALDDIVQGVEMALLVASAHVETRAPLQTLVGDGKTFARELARAAAADGGAQGLFRNGVAQLLALLGGPGLGQVPGGVERAVVVEEPYPEGRQRREPAPRTGIGAA